MKKIKKIYFLSFMALIFGNSVLYSQNGNSLSDAEVASVAVVANKIDISYAEIAVKRSKNKDILSFANTMIKDHNAVISQAAALVKRLGVKPEDNNVSQSLIKGSIETISKLNSVDDQSFDKLYIDNEVAYHKAVIEAVKSLLIPETENTELKELLEAVLPALEVHLSHAEMVQKKFSK